MNNEKIVAYKIKDDFLYKHWLLYNKLKGICSFSEYLYYMVGGVLNEFLHADFISKNNIVLTEFTPNENDAIRITNAYIFNSYKELDNEQQTK